MSCRDKAGLLPNRIAGSIVQCGRCMPTVPRGLGFLSSRARSVKAGREELPGPSLASRSVTSSEDLDEDHSLTSLEIKPFSRCRSGRSEFSLERWKSHKSTWRYLRHLRTLVNSTTLASLLGPVGILTSFAALTASYETLASLGYVPSMGYVSILEGPLEAMSFALSLLLVFRTDSSYARWEEALGCWNDIRLAEKSIIRQTLCSMQSESLSCMLHRYTLAFHRALFVRLRGGSLRSHLRGVLTPRELHTVVASGDPVENVLNTMVTIVHASNVSEPQSGVLLQNIATLQQCAATCEKLLRYPIPLSYTRHTSRFLMLWLACLPSAMWQQCGWGIVPITLTVSYLLLGIEEIGVQIEEPFHMLPLEEVCLEVETCTEDMRKQQTAISRLVESTRGYGSTVPLTLGNNVVAINDSLGSTRMPSVGPMKVASGSDA